MNKHYLAQELARSNRSLTIQKARKIIDLFFDNITDGIVSGKRVELRGFGTIHSVERKDRIARNPRTGEEVKVDGKKYVHFKAGSILKNKINSANKNSKDQGSASA